MKPRLRYRTDRAWFSRLVRHPARKQSGSILTTPEPAGAPHAVTGPTTTTTNTTTDINLPNSCAKISTDNSYYYYYYSTTTTAEITMKMCSEETQILRAGCSKAEPKIFAPP